MYEREISKYTELNTKEEEELKKLKEEANRLRLQISQFGI